MLLYESAKVPHGRQFPFQGEYYDNIFIHFQLKNYDFSETAANINGCLNVPESAKKKFHSRKSEF